MGCNTHNVAPYLKNNHFIFRVKPGLDMPSQPASLSMSVLIPRNRPALRKMYAVSAGPPAKRPSRKPKNCHSAFKMAVRGIPE